MDADTAAGIKQVIQGVYLGGTIPFGLIAFMTLAQTNTWSFWSIMAMVCFTVFWPIFLAWVLYDSIVDGSLS